ncbi:MAG: hypothetical protein ACPG07_04535 [Henriciella sp.]
MGVLRGEIALPQRSAEGRRHIEQAEQTGLPGGIDTQMRWRAGHHHEADIEGGRANRPVDGVTGRAGSSEQRRDIDDGDGGNGVAREISCFGRFYSA